MADQDETQVKLDLIIEGQPGQVSLASFVRVLERSLSVLTHLDSVVSGVKTGILDWYVTDLRMGSLAAEVVPRQRPRTLLYHSDTGPQVVEAFIEGLRLVEEQATVPPNFEETAMNRMKLLGTSFQKNGARSMSASAPGQPPARVTPQLAANARDALKIATEAKGSVIGMLEVINVHGGRVFSVYDIVRRRPVRCHFPDEMMAEVKDALTRRVLVEGVLRRNRLGDLVRVLVERLEVLPELIEAPSVDELLGSDPGFTGGLSSEDYVRGLRGA